MAKAREGKNLFLPQGHKERNTVYVVLHDGQPSGTIFKIRAENRQDQEG